MGCCGKKRDELRAAARGGVTDSEYGEGNLPVGEPAPEVSTPADRVFHYTGNDSLVIKAPLGRRSYFFSAGNRDVLVNGEDVALVKGYRDLAVR
jgi:hypothetical protein